MIKWNKSQTVPLELTGNQFDFRACEQNFDKPRSMNKFQH